MKDLIAGAERHRANIRNGKFGRMLTAEEQRAKRREYTGNYNKRWAKISVSLGVYERIARAAKELRTTQARIIERACAGVGK